MKTLEELAAIKTHFWLPWTCGWYPCKPATDESIAHIEKLLQFTLPKDFIALSRLSHNYGVWFGSIGDDYDSHNHLLTLNKAFYQTDESGIALPQHLVLINHGHDSDCDCFDISVGATVEEYPIYYMNVEHPREPKLLANSFREYLDWLR